MKKIIDRALRFLKENGVDDGDVRYTKIKSEEIYTEDKNLSKYKQNEHESIGIRVNINGNIGFAGSYKFDDIEKIAKRAIDMANHRSDNNISHNIHNSEVVIDEYTTPIKINPFDVPLEEKLSVLYKNAELALEEKDVYKVYGTMWFKKENKIYANTKGSYIKQELYKTCVNEEVEARKNGDIQVRNFPNSYGGNIATAGYEYILEQEFEKNIKNISKEAVQLCDAEVCPPGKYDIIIDPDQLAIQIHESIGHAMELDRVLGYEISLAGGSFLTLEDLKNNSVYGNDNLTITVDPTYPKACGTYGYDDDGNKSVCTCLIEKGRIKNYISSQETARLIGSKSNSNCIAENGELPPIVRMSNVNMAPGKYTMTELLSKVKYGLYLKTNSSWSIDDKRNNFQFGCEIAYEIKDGKFTGKIFKNIIYTGISKEFWSKCDGSCNGDYWKMYCAASCGKGIPYQSICVGHGSSPTLFRQIKIGVSHG